ncbi:MAG: glycosyltransferase [Muribaculaceae bacterium]|nr:glycosyltransferase [Muribaculaceae bacterium]
MMKSNGVLVSIVISVYNYRYPDNLKAVLKSIAHQTVSHEVILVEQSSQPSSIYKELAGEYRIKYIHTYSESKQNQELYNLGRVRNVGACVASGEYLYFTDADILFLNNKYLDELIRVSKSWGANLYRPSMYRLLERSRVEFINDYMNDIEISIDDGKMFCIAVYNQTEHKIEISPDDEIIDIINGQYHVCSKKDYNRVKNNKEFHSDKIEEFIWVPTFHYGGTLIKKCDFWRIGGYCEQYYNWGLEDEDIHWKMKTLTKSKEIYNVCSSLKMLHFEHKKNMNNLIYKKNREVYDERLRDGVEKSLENDLDNIKKYIDKI